MITLSDVRRHLGLAKPATVYDDDGAAGTFEVSGHVFVVDATDRMGSDSGRTRWKVGCQTCGVLVHGGTTSAPSCIAAHLVDVEVP